MPSVGMKADNCCEWVKAGGVNITHKDFNDWALFESL